MRDGIESLNQIMRGLTEMEDIPGFKNLYAITEDGKVFSYPKKWSPHGKWLKSYICKKGYVYFGLTKDGKVKNYSAHRLVGITYLENIDNKPQINHIDGNKQNNDISNLSFVTQSENMKHSYRELKRKHPKSMLGKFGINHNRSKGFWIKNISGKITFYGSAAEFERETKLPKSSINDAMRRMIDNYIFIKGKTKGLTLYLNKPNHEWTID